MTPTVKDLISTAVKAAGNQATAQTATRAAVAGIAAQRGSTGRAEPIPANGHTGGIGGTP